MICIDFMSNDVILCSNVYDDAVQHASAYNSKLTRDRKKRSPYYDAQTGIPHIPGKLWKNEKDRQQGQQPGKVR